MFSQLQDRPARRSGEVWTAEAGFKMSVMPAYAGIHLGFPSKDRENLDSRFRGNDDKMC